MVIIGMAISGKSRKTYLVWIRKNLEIPSYHFFLFTLKNESGEIFGNSA